MTETEIRSQPYRLTKADYIDYYICGYWRAFIALPSALWMWLIILVPGATLVAINLKDGHPGRALLIVAGLAAFWFVIIPAVGILTMLGNLSRSTNAYIPRTAIISGAGFALESTGFTNRQIWSQFRGVRITRRLVYLVMAVGTGIIIPKSAFADAAERDTFVAACRRHIRSSRDPQAQVFDTPMLATPLPGSLETPPHRLGFGLFAALYMLSLVRTFTRPIMGLIVLALAGLTAWVHRAQMAAGDFSSLLALAGGALLWLALFLPAMTLLNWLAVRKKPIIRQPRRTAISAEQIRTYGEAFDVAVTWTAIRRIDRRFGAIQFWTGRAAAIAVPLSAFPSREAAQAFQDQATAYWRAASLTPR